MVRTDQPRHQCFVKSGRAWLQSMVITLKPSPCLGRIPLHECNIHCRIEEDLVGARFAPSWSSCSSHSSPHGAVYGHGGWEEHPAGLPPIHHHLLLYQRLSRNAMCSFLDAEEAVLHLVTTVTCVADNARSYGVNVVFLILQRRPPFFRTLCGYPSELFCFFYFWASSGSLTGDTNSGRLERPQPPPLPLFELLYSSYHGRTRSL
jgi:hypothetical protein